MEPLQQSQPNIQKLTLLSNLPNELPQRDPRPIIPKLAEIKQKAAAKFPNLGLDAYEIVKANDYMYAAQHKTTKEVIVVFTGQNIALIGIASCLVSALKFARDIIKDYNNCKITLTGFGPGAALAERVAYFTGKPCESFNPAPMSQNFDELFHSLANVTERTVQPNSIPRVNVQIKPVRPEETKTNTNGSVSLDNLNYNELARIKGIYMDEKTNACSFVLRPAAEANSLDISVSDLLTALAIFYDPNVNTKHISFSLEPADEKNPQCEQQMKVYWPDKSDSKTILQGTELGEVFFKADYHMKQMSMGVQPTMEAGKPGNKEFAYPERLTKLGVQPSYKYGNYKKGQLDWSRLWLVVKELKVNRLSGNKKVKYFDITDVVMGVEARQMMVSQTGKLEDMQIQDTNHGSYKFAKKFTELYEEIAKEYPVYQRLKQAAKAVALAQWMWVNRVPIDFQRIKGMVKKVTNYTNLVPALEHQFEAEGHTLRVFGGVDMGISFNQLIEPDMKGLMKFEEPKSVQVTSSMLQQPPQFQDSIPNPFVQKANCATCSCRLHLAELLYPHEGNYYCTNHHPLYCWGCYDFIQEKYMKLGNSAAFHADCFTCAKCAHPLSGQLGMIAETAYMHKDCSSSATKELMAARVKDQPSPGQSPSSSGAALTVFQRKLDRVLSMNGNGDAVAYSLIPPSAGSQEGYKLGKTGLDTSGPSGEQLLPVIQNILERTGMDNASAVIEKLKGKKALTQQEINSVNEKLGGFGGKKVIDDIYNRVLAGTASHIDTVIESISDATMKEKVKKSEHAKLLLVDYENQWKLDTRLVAFLSAKTVPVDQTTQVTIDKNADVASEINRLVDMTKVNATNKTEVMRRRNNVEKIAKEETA